MYRPCGTRNTGPVSLAAVLALGATTATTTGQSQPPAQIQLTGVIRDFKAYGQPSGHYTMERPDMPSGLGSRWVIGNLVQPTLGPDNKPVFSGAGIIVKTAWKDVAGRNIAMQLPPRPNDTPGQTTSLWHDYLNAATFGELFNDVPGVNMSAPLTLTFNRLANGNYEFYADTDPTMPGGFFPIDNRLLGNYSNSGHNFHFSFELHTEFTYQPGLTFQFSGDDDVWVFINRQIVVDLGGRHSEKSMFVDLGRLNLTNNQTYPLDFFMMERKTSGSHCRITTNMALRAPTPDPVSISDQCD